MKQAICVLQPGGMNYTFKTQIENLEEGDMVVVDTRYGIKLAQFKAYTDTTLYGERWLFERVPMWELNKLKLLDAEMKEKEKKAKENEKKRRQLLLELSAIDVEEDMMQKFEAIAKKNPKAKELLDEYKKLL